MRFFAHSVPGLGSVLAEEVTLTSTLEGAVETDGRNDVVVFSRSGEAPTLRLAEDVFVQVGETRAGSPLSALVGALTTTEELERALSVYAAAVRPLRRRATFRVVARVSSERDFARTAFRDGLRKALAATRPKWTDDDPAELEFWGLQCGTTFRLGLRLTGGPGSRRTTRSEERPGALRPSVAAAMISLAGNTDAVVIDPFCGVGTILIEGRAAGFSVVGTDIDAGAVALSWLNAAASVSVADAQALPFANRIFGAVVSNLPWGGRFPAAVDDQELLDELLRVSRPSARLVLLTSAAFTASLKRKDLEVTRSLDIRVLGRDATISVVERRG